MKKKRLNPTIKRVINASLSLQRFQWEQGVLAQAFLELDETDLAVLLAKSAAYRNEADGRLGVMDLNRSVDDPAAVGEALLYAAAITKDQALKEAADKLYFYLKYRAPKTTDGILYHYNIMNEVWVDAYYMAPPFLAAYGDIDEAMKQITGFRRFLFDESQQLHAHIWDDDRNRLGRRDFWGVGNGWAVSGVTRVIGLLDESRKEEHDYLIEFVRIMLEGITALQCCDGRYYNVLNNPETFIDTNTGQMTAYSIYKGIASGYLEDHYLEIAEASRRAAYRMVDTYGFVQDVCGMPNFDRPYVAPEGQAFFLLMEAAAQELEERGYQLWQPENK